MDLASYLARIGHPDGLAPTLFDLHERHQFTVPFENLDIMHGIPIVLDEARILDKIVNRRRGGFCYELNGGFTWLLRQLGLPVAVLAAQVWSRTNEAWGIDFDHMVLRVDLERSWLVDVGFFEGFLSPLPYEGTPDRQQGWTWSIRDEDGHRVLQRDGAPRYRFSEQEYELADFEAASTYHQKAPDSWFRQHAGASLATPSGRIALVDGMLIETTSKGKTESPVDDPTAVFRDRFGITVNTA